MKAILLLSSLLFLPQLRSEDSGPKVDDPLAKRMEGSWKANFDSNVGGTARNYAIYRIHLGGKWVQTIIDSATGKKVTQEAGTYKAPPNSGKFLVPEDVVFSSPGRPNTIEMVKVINLQHLQLGDDRQKSPLVFERIPADKVPQDARLK